MAEEGRLSWKESNLANIGSDLDHKIKEAAAEGEEAWKVIGEAPGVKVWRVEQFNIVAWPEADYGCFYKGDSYIVLNSWIAEGQDKLNHDLYIWIGSESSQDEYGTAAYKMVEADDYVGGIAVQHREVQGHESPKFKELFGNLTYWTGGIASGFNHVEPTEEKPNFYMIKGTEKNMSLTQVPLEKGWMNSGDSFVLKASASQVWLWNGESANPDEKARAIKFAEKMCTEGTVTVLEQGAGDEEDAAFWAYLKEGEIAEAADDDHIVEEFTPLLFKLPEGDDDLEEAEQVGKGEKVKIGFTTQCKISKDLLDESDVFLLDAGWELFLWIGKNADRSEKLGAFAKADKYCQADLRTVDLPLSIVKSGYEQADFNNFFA
mmetsp:Transcript_81753/g.122808  ORF Transcript_81753/g.122808 Transcript_81753/m.122808 type:complete len:376 (-) Transcript_81753:180-1307(-)